MFLSLDIETMADAGRVANLPEPETDARLVDPAKIKAAKEKAKAKQIAQAALSPLTGRVICCGLFSGNQGDSLCPTLTNVSDANEATLLQFVFGQIAVEGVRLVTFNGNHFDLPFIYRRAMILGIYPANFRAPPLTAWTKRYDNARHVDLISVWAGSDRVADFDNLADVALAILGETRAEEEYDKFPMMMQTKEGRDHISKACLHHAELTYRIFERAQGCLFA